MAGSFNSSFNSSFDAGASRANVEGSDAVIWKVAIDDTSCSCERPAGMAYNIHDLGDEVRVSATFTDPTTGDVLDPDVVLLAIKDPDGEVTEYTYGTGGMIERDDVGKFHADVDAELSGFWFYRWRSTGEGQAAQERRFRVREAHAVES